MGFHKAEFLNDEIHLLVAWSEGEEPVNPHGELDHQLVGVQ